VSKILTISELIFEAELALVLNPQKAEKEMTILITFFF
jgi:hypothetical protein